MKECNYHWKTDALRVSFPQILQSVWCYPVGKQKIVKMKENAEKKNVNEVHVTKWQHEQSSCHDNVKGIQFLINIFDEDLYCH